jgi:hypothetical protein
MHSKTNSDNDSPFPLRRQLLRYTRKVTDINENGTSSCALHKQRSVRRPKGIAHRDQPSVCAGSSPTSTNHILQRCYFLTTQRTRGPSHGVAFGMQRRLILAAVDASVSTATTAARASSVALTPAAVLMFASCATGTRRGTLLVAQHRDDDAGKEHTQSLVVFMMLARRQCRWGSRRHADMCCVVVFRFFFLLAVHKLVTRWCVLQPNALSINPPIQSRSVTCRSKALQFTYSATCKRHASQKQK